MLPQYSSLGPVGSSQGIAWMCLTIFWNQFFRYLSIWYNYLGTFIWLYLLVVCIYLHEKSD